MISTTMRYDMLHLDKVLSENYLVFIGCTKILQNVKKEHCKLNNSTVHVAVYRYEIGRIKFSKRISFTRL